MHGWRKTEFEWPEKECDEHGWQSPIVVCPACVMEVLDHECEGSEQMPVIKVKVKKL